ncbi:aldose-1-epimerase [Georgenia sp. SYP-B2076]|uniref:aldose-1-epimerase n=1 Tax=Georgenia sp. SYP-B2076 TaxID=2495881 RepID=UPI000F8EC96A|nr:aldose-1-epimerase [Georgenia sp. SYP-B2076]
MSANLPSPNGTVLTLAAGEYEATVFSVGASLARLTWRGTDLVVPSSEAEIPTGYLGKTLVPWPNRIADGRYEFGGATYEVPITEHATRTALHGLACWVDWDVVDAGPDEVTLSTMLVPQYGYPFQLRSEVTYRLGPEGLQVAISSANVGATAAPYGSSSHPYLSCGLVAVDACTLQFPARQVLTVDERLLPVSGVPTAQAGLDFQDARTIGDRQIDHAFGELPPDGWEVRFHDPGSGLGVRLTARAPWLQIYSGERVGRRGVAVEPMTCPPDAFNSTVDLVVLQPGERHTLRFRIDGFRAE